MPARAALLVHEPFNYTAGELLSAQNGGTGFVNAWSDSSVAGNQDVIGTGSLVYPGLQTSGNSAVQLSPTSSLSSNVRRQIFTIPGTAGTSTWVSFLFSLDSTAPLTAADWATLTVAPVNLGGGPYFGIFNDPTGDPGDKVFGIGSNQTTALTLSNVPLNAGQTYFLAARIDWKAGATAETVTLFIDPPTGNTAPSGPSWSTDMNIATGAGTNRLFYLGMFAGDTGTEWAFDEIRIGNSFGDVAPVPEPAALTLLAAGFAVYISRRNRRRLD